MDAGDQPVELADLARLGKMFEEHRDRLLAMIQHRSPPALRARRDPEDVLGDAFLKARKRWADFDRSGMQPFTWLYRLVLDCLHDDRDYHGRIVRNYQAELPWPDQSSRQVILNLVSPITSPSSEAARHEAEERLDRVLDQLRSEERDILTMRYVDGLGQRQIAEVLGISSGAAGQRLYRAHESLRRLWKEQFGHQSLKP